MGIIYVIKNDINDKPYVGKTVTTLANRWLHHKDDYQKYDWHLYRAMRRYGIEHFWIEQIEECDDAIIDEREVYWINQLDSYNCGYNMTIGGEGRTALNREKIIQLWNEGYSALQIANEVGSKWSGPIIDVLEQQGLYDAEEIKRRKMIDIANKQSLNRVIQYNEKAEVVNVFNSKKEAAEYTGISRKNISTALTTGQGAGGFLWRRENEEPPKPRKIKTQKKRKIEQINLESGEVVAIYNTTREAAQAVQGTSSTISAVCNGHRNKHKGFGWRYIE